MRFFNILFASGFGSGFAPFAPGTFGTLVGSILVVLFWQLGILYEPFGLSSYTIIFSLIGWYAINELPENWVHDDQRIVVDEVIGLFVALLFVPITWTTIILSFVLFRFFDILKPLGIRKFDNLHSNWSVIVDDIVAGIYANISLQLILLALKYI